MVINNEKLNLFSNIVSSGEVANYEGTLKTGVDLGTANIVISVVDEQNQPVAGASFPSKVVKDGIVVDFVGAIQVLRKLKMQLEQKLNASLTEASIAIPPGIIEGNVKCIANVVESAEFDVVNIVDEPTAAASVLEITDGAVVDVGGGTTGISILKDGKVIFTADEPTGGNHMSLVVAGYYHINLDEAEELKKDTTKQHEIFPIIKPVVEKMATIVKNSVRGYDVKEIYVVGGASCFDGFEEVFEKEIGIKTIKTNDPLLVTPLGIAINYEK